MESRLSFGPGGIVNGGEPVRLGRGGRAILMLHGFGDTPQSLRPLAIAMHARGWTVHAPLLSGHGRPLRDLARSRAADWLADARRALAELQLEATTVSIVGQSMGGAIAVTLAAESNPMSLVLLAPYLSMSRRGSRIARFRWLVSVFVPVIVTRTDSSILDPEARRQALGAGVTTPRLARELAGIVRGAWQSAPSVTAPTLVIHSRRDPRIPVRDAERGYARIGAPGKALRWVEGSGHVLAVDYDRDLIATEVASWLEQHSARRKDP